MLLTTAAATVEAATVLASGVVAVGSAVLLVYLYVYARDIAVEINLRDLWPLAMGIGAGVVYGLASIADTLTSVAWLGSFVEGATLFFILGVALGIRGLALSRRDRSTTALPQWLDYAVLAAFVASWWLGFLLSGSTRLVVVAGWVGASLWALYYSVLAVRTHEGTSIAALVRNLLPAVIAVAGVVFVDIVGRYLDAVGVVDAVWLVGTVLVGTFLFTTAVAIRQQGGEVERMYDWTTWRGDRGRDPGVESVENGGD
jgi:hypothetical protein